MESFPLSSAASSCCSSSHTSAVLSRQLRPTTLSVIPSLYQFTDKAAICSLRSISSCQQRSSSRSRHSSSVQTFYRYNNNHKYNVGEEEEGCNEDDCNFEDAVALFNRREYYKCHDSLEALWMKAEEPAKTLFHGILQCAVGFHHLFNKNHSGAMMELGEGLCKLKKLNFESGPFHQFEQDISAALEFVYQTQIELAACADDLCLSMDRSERSYQLLGGYAAGQKLYILENDPNKEVAYIVFYPPIERSYNSSSEPPKVKLPILKATEEHLNMVRIYQ